MLTDLVLLEIIQGVRKKEQRTKLEKYFDAFVCLPMQRSSVVLAADIYQELERRGLRLRSLVDCVIAAIAIESGTSILHKDRDFHRIAEHFPVTPVKE